jgi:BirA family biotin operon repressor/biotin-[acetyl-CoA-carboxylase] ligase
MSILLRPHCAPTELLHLTCAAAVAMCDAVEAAVGFRPGIKWTNDLVFGKRKLGGILTELGFTPKGEVDYAIIGIGINCTQTAEDFPPDLREMASSLSAVAGKPVVPARLAAAMVSRLLEMNRRLLTEKAALLDRYREDCVTLGREVVLVRGEERQYGTALDIDSEGALLVRFRDGQIRPVASGEVSVRGMYGYL